MSFIIENWILLITLFACVFSVCCYVRFFSAQPTEDQLNKIREWLLYAVTMAEKEYGNGTGKIKLRYVYDLFLVKFPWIARVISFEMFSELVDRVLEEMRSMLEQNERVAELVNS